MNSRLIKKIICQALILSTVICSLIPLKTTMAAKKAERFDVKLSYGCDDMLDSFKPAAFTVTIKNTGEDFAGSVILTIIGTAGETEGYEKKFSIASNTEKSLVIIANLGPESSNCKVEIANNKGKILQSTKFNLTFDAVSEYAKIGIFTDDINSLSYLSGEKLSGFEQILLRTVRLTEDQLSDDYRALSMFNCIIIADYSTDRLTKSQIKVLTDWVSMGGTLIFATGENYNKVFAGFKDIVPVEYGKLRTITTDFGLSSVDFGSLRFYEENSENDYFLSCYNVIRGIDWAKYEKDGSVALDLYDFAGILVNDYPELLKEYLWELNRGEKYSEMEKILDKTTLAQCEADFFNSCRYSYCQDVISIYFTTFRNSILNPPKIEKTFFKASILELPEKNTILRAYDQDNDMYFPLATYMKYKNGKIGFLATDITKEPFINCKNCKDIISYVILKLDDNKLVTAYTEASGTYYSNKNTYDYYLARIADEITAGKPVPFLLLALILSAYVIICFIAYFYLKKRNRSILLWPVYICCSAASVILICLASLTTRLSKPQLSEMKITNVTDMGATSKSLISITLPQNKQYRISFKKDFTPSVLRNGYTNYYSYKSIDEPCGITWLDYDNVTAMEVRGDSAMDVKSFFNEIPSPKDNYDITFTPSFESGKLTGFIKNNTDYTIENAAVLIDYAIYVIGDIDPGKTINLSSLKCETLIDPTSIVYYYASYKSIPLMLIKSDNSRTMQYILGFSYPALQKENIRQCALAYFLNSICDTHGAGNESINLYDRYYNSPSSFLSESELYNFLDLDTEGNPQYLTNPIYFIGFKSNITESMLADQKTATEKAEELIYIKSSNQ